MKKVILNEIILAWIFAGIVMKARANMREVRCAEDVCEDCPFAECFINSRKKKVPLSTGEMVLIVKDSERAGKYAYTTRVNKHKGR